MMLVRQNKLTPLQRSVLTGSMLGDGNLNIPERGINARLIIKRKLEDQDYLQWEYELFKDFCTQNPIIEYKYDNRTERIYPAVYFYTRHLDIFTSYYYKWYKDQKIVPKDLELDGYSLLIWFLDDGCVVSNKNGRLDLQLSTDGFLREDTEYLVDKLYKRYDACFSINSDGRIIAADAATRKFLREIDPICPNFMERKSNKWKLSTDIYDENIKVFRSRKLQPVVDMHKFTQVIYSQGNKFFTTRDIAEACQLFCLKKGKKRYYHDIVMNKLAPLIQQNIISMIDPGFRKTKIFSIIDAERLI